MPRMSLTMFSGQSIRLAVKSCSWNPTQVEWKHAAQCVQVEEKDRIGKFVFKRDAKSAMVGRLLLRYAVSKMMDVPSRVLRFDRTEKGKPFLLSPVDKSSSRCDISFNISHQGDYVVLAAERGQPVGIDVMKVEWPRNTPITKFFGTMERQFTSDEWSEVNKWKEDLDKLKTFFRFWCLKESLVKALGVGIGLELNRLNFIFRTQNLSPDHVTRDTVLEIDADLATEWEFEETMLEDHCLAVAVKRSSENSPGTESNKSDVPPFHVLDVQDLLDGCEPLAGNTPDMEYWELFSSRAEEPGYR